MSGWCELYPVFVVQDFRLCSFSSIAVNHSNYEFAKMCTFSYFDNYHPGCFTSISHTQLHNKWTSQLAHLTMINCDTFHTITRPKYNSFINDIIIEVSSD